MNSQHISNIKVDDLENKDINDNNTINSEDLYVTESDNKYSDIHEEINIKKINKMRKIFLNYNQDTDSEKLTDSNLSSINSD
jgi:hypothetical protein